MNQYFNSLSICIIYDDEFTKKESYRYTKVIKKRKDLKKQHDVTHFFHSLYIFTGISFVRVSNLYI